MLLVAYIQRILTSVTTLQKHYNISEVLQPPKHCNSWANVKCVVMPKSVTSIVTHYNTLQCFLQFSDIAPCATWSQLVTPYDISHNSYIDSGVWGHTLTDRIHPLECPLVDLLELHEHLDITMPLVSEMPWQKLPSHSTQVWLYI